MNSKNDPPKVAPLLTRRMSGVLLHPTSLPGPYGIGDLGPEARAFIDFLYASGQQMWEVLPLGPTGYGDSPYQGLSAFAGNPNLISPDLLRADRLLAADDLADVPQFNDAAVDFGAVLPWKRSLLQRAFERFSAGASIDLIGQMKEFRAAEAAWLDDYVLFAAIKESQGGAEWTRWPQELATRKPAALKKARAELSNSIDYHVFTQFIFFRQWLDLKKYANERSINIIGDIPIFMGHDSADVWANQDIFYMDDKGQLLVVAAAAPDFFITEGQLWGNPLYRWDVLKKRGYSWWLDRFRMGLRQADIIRLDHFRGFAAYWEVKAGSPNAINGRWAPGPNADLFEVVAKTLGPLPLVAEDLGLITEDVHELRAKLGYPGMKILQEAFHNDPTNIYLPHNYARDFAVYTGTHDMQTTRAWWDNQSEVVKHYARVYLGTSGDDIVWDLIRVALASVADMAIFPVQDLLDLDNSARMNTPGYPSGNWVWRYQKGQLSSALAERLGLLTRTYGRATPQTAPASH